MSEEQVRSAVNWWAKRVGPRTVFDYDDARQEARIALWVAESRGQPVRGYRLYKRILDGMRKAIPGFRTREALVFVDDEEGPEPWHEYTPERLLAARQHLAYVELLPEPEREIAKLVMAGSTVTELAQLYGVSASRISQRLQSACRQLVRQHAKDAGLPNRAKAKLEPLPVPNEAMLDARLKAAQAAAMFNEAMKDDHATLS